MRVILKAYNDRESYKEDISFRDKEMESIGAAIKEAKRHIRNSGNKQGFLGFKIYSTKGELKHKLPST